MQNKGIIFFVILNRIPAELPAGWIIGIKFRPLFRCINILNECHQKLQHLSKWYKYIDAAVYFV